MVSFSMNDKSFSLKSLVAIGEGGEGIVYDLGKLMPGRVLKVFKRPAEYRGEGKKVYGAALKRRKELHAKLCAMPELPRRVVAPEGILFDRRKMVAALVLPKVQGGFSLSELVEREKRIRRGYMLRGICELLSDIHETIVRLHAIGVIVGGDFKPDNFLVCFRAAFMIDSESLQFGKFAATGFTEDYLDPALYKRNPKTEEISEIRAFTEESDWFSFAAIALQLLLGVLPYGGSHLPQNGKAVPAINRPHCGVSVFSDDVILPPRAAPFSILPDALLKTFRSIFSHSQRGVFPIAQIADATWVTCDKCALEHGRVTCPKCNP